MADFVVMENENNSMIQRLSIPLISISSGDYAVVGKSHWRINLIVTKV